eukprot:CAMPEP_0169118746 /NCGR_PEP_ID=MMETSP1015-20121227/31165_1 /TAXON_ID=342587 /ORGANISM="Karlodinium micrum, Strain CCMP2283" /LENGTH=166 /DNA_ID=CAMNT_0009181535 /DNA_START=57 /DNA_END=557 /DNA_ORIENTATION=-
MTSVPGRGARSVSVPGLRTEKDAGVNYLRGSKVGSATGYLCVAGSVLALPHGKRSKSMTSSSTRFEGLSEQAHKFREMPHCYASMDKKPLLPYDPLSYRSRLAVDDAPVPLKNCSTIQFNDGIHTCHKRRFITTNDMAYTGEPCDPRNNQGILAEATQFRRFHSSK